MALLQKLHSHKMPMIMGILNLAPDSFASEGRCTTLDSALQHVEKIIADGVDIIDIGAEPTNPKQKGFVIDSDAELKALLPVINVIKQHFDVPISVDTSDPIVMQAVVDAGADMINDIRALTRPGALETVIKLDVPVCLMHMKYPDGMPTKDYIEVEQECLPEIENFFRTRLDEVCTAGLKRENIILDPGIGGGSFGKSTQDNLKIINAIDKFKQLGFSVLIGLSRKTFIRDLLDCAEYETVHAGLVLNYEAAKQGAAIIRTHDVRALKDALTMLEALEEAKNDK